MEILDYHSDSHGVRFSIYRGRSARRTVLRWEHYVCMGIAAFAAFMIYLKVTGLVLESLF